MTRQPVAESLEQLEGRRWGDPGPDATRLMRDVHAARTVPVAQLTAEQLRILLRQDVGVDHIVPAALRLLADDPLVEADYYPGDLLAAVLDLDPARWAAHPDEAAEVEALLNAVDPADERLLDSPDLIDSATRFRAAR